MTKPIDRKSAEYIADLIAINIDSAEDAYHFVCNLALEHRHPAVERAEWAIRAAKRAAVAGLAQELEGLVSAAMQRRAAEDVVGWLAKLLALAQPASARRDDVLAEYCTEARIRPENFHDLRKHAYGLITPDLVADLADICAAPKTDTGPRWPHTPYGEVFIGRDGCTDIWYRSDGYIVSAQQGFVTSYAESSLRRVNTQEGGRSAFTSVLTLLDAHLARKADTVPCKCCRKTHATIPTFYGCCAPCIAADPYTPPSMRAEAKQMIATMVLA